MNHSPESSEQKHPRPMPVSYEQIAERLILSPLAEIRDVDYADEQDIYAPQPHEFAVTFPADVLLESFQARHLSEMPLRGEIAYIERFTMDGGRTTERPCVTVTVHSQLEGDDLMFVQRLITLENEGGRHYVSEQYYTPEGPIASHDGTPQSMIESRKRDQRDIRIEDYELIAELLNRAGV